MKANSRESWSRLIALARLAPHSNAEAVEAPFGFATRVAARGLEVMDRGVASLFEPFALRALGIAAVAAIMIMALGFNPVLQSIREEVAAVGADPVSVLVD
ncbi:MAG TPA: hypothetical protein PLV87_01895 [Opitutaceae bacterium]|nr:hypothetical protein [Opitutaceae bacterium]